MAGMRWLRASLLSALAMVTGAVAHVGAGGLLPGLPDVVFLHALLTLACAALLASRASATRAVLLMVGGQSFVHLGLTALAGHAHDMHAAHALPSPELAGSQAPMALAHLLAAAAIGLWLAYGEAALFAVLALMAAAIRKALVRNLALFVTPTRVTGRSFAVVPLHTLLARRAQPRRGPPAAALVTA